MCVCVCDAELRQFNIDFNAVGRGTASQREGMTDVCVCVHDAVLRQCNIDLSAFGPASSSQRQSDGVCVCVCGTGPSLHNTVGQ